MRLLAPLAVVAASLIVPFAGSSAAEVECSWELDPETGQYERVCEDNGGGPGGPGPRGPEIGDEKPEEYLTPACSGNGPPPNGGDNLCMGATSTCRDREPEVTGMRMFVYTRTLRWNGTDWVPVSPWQSQGSRCEYNEPDDPITPQVVIDFMKGQLPKPQVGTSPPGARTIVNFDTIFHTDGSGYEQQHTILGRQVLVKAERTSFAWDFGEARKTTPHSGVPYAKGTDPGKYVKYTYQEPGDYTVSVAVTWHVTFSVNGGPEQDGGNATLTSPGAQLTVVSVEGRLGGN